MNFRRDLFRHPSRKSLEVFLSGGREPEEARKVHRHIIDGCSRCLQALRVLSVRRGQYQGIGARDPSGEGHTPSERGRSRLLYPSEAALLEGERRLAARLRLELLDLPVNHARSLIQRDPRFRVYPLADVLQEEALSLVVRAPSRAVEIAQLSVAVAERLDPGAYPQGIVADASTRAWAALGNAHRILGELVPARTALETASRRLAIGSGDPVEAIDALRLLGSLYVDMALYEKATTALEEALFLSQQVRDERREAMALMVLSRCRGESGMPEASVHLLHRAEALLEREQDNRLLMYARHARASWLTDAGRSWEAAALLRSFYATYKRQLTSGRQALRLPWLRAKIDHGFGLHRRSSERLEEVVLGYREWDDPLSWSAASMDLCEVYLDGGHERQAEKLALQVLPFLTSQNVHRTALRVEGLIRRARGEKPPPDSPAM